MFQVEIDLLTGATTILRTDIIYDCGQSLNPAVDLGQVGLNTMVHLQVSLSSCLARLELDEMKTLVVPI